MALRFLGLLSLNAPASGMMRFSFGQSPLNIIPTLSSGPGGMGMDANNPMQEIALAFKATVDTFRSPDAVLALKRFHSRQGELADNISTRIVQRVAQLEEEKRNGGGPELLARALLDYEKEMKEFGRIAPEIINETKAVLPPGSAVRPEDQLDSGPMMFQLNWTFNDWAKFALEADANLNTSTVSERCDHLRPVVTKMRNLMWDIARFSAEEEKNITQVDGVDSSPVVMFAPDIMPKFRDFAISTNMNIVHLTRCFALAIGNVTDFVMTNAEKDLGCSVLDKSHARPQQRLGLLMGLALATAVALGFVF